MTMKTLAVVACMANGVASTTAVNPASIGNMEA